LPIEARHHTGPLFWLHGDESKTQLENELQKVLEGGNGTFTAESRPHSDWLGEGWFRDLGICLDFARSHAMTMWIFDEKWWPSGEVGGKVPQQYGAKMLLGLARQIKQQLNIPVICSLQDEDVWVDAMSDPYRQKVWDLMSERGKDIDKFIAVSDFFAQGSS
jgi:hypothetical protein